MKIAVVVHGRFYAFELARALLDRGHEVTVFTNYPRFACRRFGLPPERVRGYWLHGMLARALHRFGQWTGRKLLEGPLHSMFSRWAAEQLSRAWWDVCHVFSGVAEEILTSTLNERTVRIVVRGSSHIRTQAMLLEEEELRSGIPIDRPSPWMIAREEREYALADRVLVLSQFAYDSFLERGFPSEKIVRMVPGVRVDEFRPSPQAIEERCARIGSGAPLRILYVGALLFRKGLMDLERIIGVLDRSRFQFTIVGPTSRESTRVLRAIRSRVEIVLKQPQHRLIEWYGQADVFTYPSLEEGFPQVLAQAHASGLPILTTANSAGRDLIRDGENGWILPIRTPEAFVERLRWCDAHRGELAAMARVIYDKARIRTWDDAARDFEVSVAPLVGHLRAVGSPPEDRSAKRSESRV